MVKILKDPAEYAKELHDSYFTPSVVRTTIDLARLRPALPEDYIEAVMDEFRRYGMARYGHVND